MINWFDNGGSVNYKKLDYGNLTKNNNFYKNFNSSDKYAKYVCKLFDEYKIILKDEPILIKTSLKRYFGELFVEMADIDKSKVIISPSDMYSYYTIKYLNNTKNKLVVICFDYHSDTYDYKETLWKGNGFSKLINEGFIDYFIVIGVPKEKRQNCLNDSNKDIRKKIYLIDENELFDTLKTLNCNNIFVSIDLDCFDCRKSLYTAVEYSPYTILNNLSYIKKINERNYKKIVKDCIYVKNDLGYSNYYRTGEGNLTVDKEVIELVHEVCEYCKKNDTMLGFQNGLYLQLMELDGYDYGNLTTNLVVKLINELVLKEVKI